MINIKYKTAILAISLCCIKGMASYAQENTQQDPQQDNATNATQPDNSQLNMRDRNGNEPTADQQKENQSDRSIVQRIRRSIISDKSLSTYAHNIKIISQGGAVTLKGPVRSDREKNLIVKKAVDVTGTPDKVTDQITVKR